MKKSLSSSRDQLRKAGIELAEKLRKIWPEIQDGSMSMFDLKFMLAILRNSNGEQVVRFETKEELLGVLGLASDIRNYERSLDSLCCWNQCEYHQFREYRLGKQNRYRCESHRVFELIDIPAGKIDGFVEFKFSKGYFDFLLNRSLKSSAYHFKTSKKPRYS